MNKQYRKQKEKWFKQGKEEAKKEFDEILNYYRRTYEEDKDALFNEGYMDNLFKELKSKLRGKWNFLHTLILD